MAQCTEVGFISFPSGEFFTYYDCNESTGRETDIPLVLYPTSVQCGLKTITMSHCIFFDAMVSRGFCYNLHSRS